MVGDKVGPQCAHRVASRLSPGRGEHGGAHGGRHLHANGADPATTTVDENGITRAELTPLDDVVPHREKRFGKGGTFFGGQGVGEHQAVVLTGLCEGGVAAAMGQRTDPGSDREVLAAGTDRDDFAGNLEPRYGRRIGRWWVKPQPL